jgi:hypothetical protein
MAVGHKLWLRLEANQDGAPKALAPDVRASRTLARSVLANTTRLLAFRAVGPNLRVVMACDHRTARSHGRRLKTSIIQRLATGPLARTVVDPLRDQWHLQNTFKFVLRNGDPQDPRHEASNLPDLLGLRVLCSRSATNVRCLLPRIKRKDLLTFLPLESLEPEVWLDDLEDCAAAAIGRGNLRGQSQETVAARSAAVTVVGRRLTGPELARLFGVSEVTIKRDRRRAAAPELVRAIMLQMCLRRRIRPAL